ncbi:MAG: hypothetical protein Q9226_008862 [Calogaya cf. arnoldii]
MVVVKRLADAITAGDAIRAVIRNSAVGQDGRTKTLTMPNLEAQTTLIRRAYEVAGLDPSETRYVEAHGTGTVVGDSVEIQSIGTAFGARKTNKSENGPLFVGSVKGNLGHLESTSGLAGLIKAVLILEKGVIPPNPHLERVKKGLELQNRGIENSFGYGGTSAHVVIETESSWRQSVHKTGAFQPCKDLHDDLAPSIPLNGHGKCVEHDAHLYVITSSSEKSLNQAIKNLRDWTIAHPNRQNGLADLSFTLIQRRSLLPLRYAFVSGSYQEVLTALASNPDQPRMAKMDHKVILLFTGQGAQWPGMARQLFRFAPFRDSLDASGRMIQELGANWDLQEELMRDKNTSQLSESEYAQPATTAIQIALVALLRQLDIQPTAVLGHSSGEIAAAYATGALNHYSAIKTSYYRGFLPQECQRLIRKTGAMLAVGMNEVDLRARFPSLGSCEDKLSIACVNSPTSTTVSGDKEAIVELKGALDNVAIPSTYLAVDTAYHSHHMQAVADFYLQRLDQISPGKSEGKTKFFSSVTASEKATEFGPQYWVSNLVSTVRFSDALKAVYQVLISEDARSISCTFVELGPHNTLTKFADQTIRKLRSELASIKEEP